MSFQKTLIPLSLALTLAGSSVACRGDFLSGGDLSSDPNRPTTASNRQLFVGVEANVFYSPNGDLTRIANIFAQYFRGDDAYRSYDRYLITEATTNGAQRQLYGPGGLGDVRLLQKGTRALHDSLFTGIAQVQEAVLMGYNADAFGDVVYSHALGEVNPPLDPQLAVYDSIQVLLSDAILNLSATGPTNMGPHDADLVYGGDASKWIALAHTLKARYYMHTAEVPARSASAYASAITEAQAGIASSADDYRAAFSGNDGEQNPWGVLAQSATRQLFHPNPAFADTLLVTRNDPRRSQYFTTGPDTSIGLSASRADLGFNQPIATHAENLLIWSEALFRTGSEGPARTHLNEERALVGLPAIASSVTGNALLRQILTEEYINDFQLGLEGWKLYRRTCFPNLPKRSTNGAPMPGRFYYDQAERTTNTNIPAPGVDPNGIRNAVDPVNENADAGAGQCVAGA